MSELVPYQPSGSIDLTGADAAVPALVAVAGERAARRFLEFFAATIRNKNTRVAYYNDVRQFFAWCERRGIDGLERIEPIHVALYVEELGHSFSKPTVKQHLAAVRMLFDWLVTGQVIRTNPAHSVRGPKHVVKRGKTPVLITDQARELLESINTSSVVGLRDRALIGVMTYTFARVGAVVGMTVDDYYPEGKRWWLRLHEKAANGTRCRRTTSSKPSSTNISTQLGSAARAALPASARRLARRAYSQACRCTASTFTA